MHTGRYGYKLVIIVPFLIYLSLVNKMLPSKWLPVALAALLLLIVPLHAGKILGFFITPSRSHFIIEDALMRGLAANGHEV